VWDFFYTSFLPQKQMSTSAEVPVIAPDAGDPVALSDPNSPASIMKAAKKQALQSTADTKYDAKPPARISSFENYVEVIQGPHLHKEQLAGLLLACSAILFLYAAAPDI
jgi:hypothetical protein